MQLIDAQYFPESLNEITNEGGVITYEEAKEKVFGTGSIPEGYWGDRADVGFFLLGNKIMILCQHGYFTSHFPPCMDEREAIWLIENRPPKNYVRNFKTRDVP